MDVTPQIIIAVCAVLSFIVSVAVACTRWFASKLKDVSDLTKRDLVALDLKTDNLSLRTDTLERKDDDKGGRLVRLEVLMENVSKVLERIEAKIDRQHDPK